MKYIKLTQNKKAIVDDKDYPILSQYKWLAHKTYGGIFYVEKKLSKNKMISMHRFLLKPRKNQEIDHINRNGLDNRRKNLRICTRGENLSNRGLFKNNTSGYTGIYRSKNKKKWNSYIGFNNKNIYLGAFKTKKLASEAYLKKKKELWKI